MDAIEGQFPPGYMPGSLASLISNWVCAVIPAREKARQEGHERDQHSKWISAAARKVPLGVAAGRFAARVVDWVGGFGRWLSWWLSWVTRSQVAAA